MLLRSLLKDRKLVGSKLTLISLLDSRNSIRILILSLKIILDIHRKIKSSLILYLLGKLLLLLLLFIINIQRFIILHNTNIQINFVLLIRIHKYPLLDWKLDLDLIYTIVTSLPLVRTSEISLIRKTTLVRETRKATLVRKTRKSTLVGWLLDLFKVYAARNRIFGKEMSCLIYLFKGNSWLFGKSYYVFV